MRPALIVTATATAALILPLSACNRGPSVSATNATPAEVQEKVAAATGNSGGVMIQPGRWEGTMTMHDLDFPNMPAAAKEQMKARLGAGRNFVSCVTPEDVKEQKAFFTGDDSKNPSCKYDHFTLAGGTIDAAMSCNRPDQGKTAMTMNGTYSPDGYHMDMTSKSQGGGPMGPMTMKMSIEAKRVGACRGTKDEL